MPIRFSSKDVVALDKILIKFGVILGEPFMQTFALGKVLYGEGGSISGVGVALKLAAEKCLIPNSLTVALAWQAYYSQQFYMVEVIRIGQVVIPRMISTLMGLLLQLAISK